MPELGRSDHFQRDLPGGNGNPRRQQDARAAGVVPGRAAQRSSTLQNTGLTGKYISLKAEGDTTLRGVTATADRIDVKTSGTLTIESP
ncbi:MAG: hemagglutinin repeat-containing protein [Stenotrophomonas sp.]